jgi:hypothetical protein
VQARNDHGWNKLSNVFHFSTRAEGEFWRGQNSISCLFMFPIFSYLFSFN